jgi:predicted dehydrogenase
LVALGCEVTVVARSAATRDNALRAGAARTVASLREARGAKGLIVATPNATHAAVIRDCLELGAPVFCEKPLTVDPQSAAAIAALGAGRLFVMEKWRYHPAIEMLGEIARSGELGAVRGLRVVRLQWGSNHLDVDGTWVLLPHDLSILREILGAIPRLASVSGHHVNDWMQHVYDTFGGGAAPKDGTMAPWACIESGVQHPGGDRREVQLYCESGTALMADPYEKHVAIYRSPGKVDRNVPAPEKRAISTEFPLLRELRAFVEHLHGGLPPKTSAAIGAEHVAVIADIRERLGLSRSVAEAGAA